MRALWAISREREQGGGYGVCGGSMAVNACRC